MDAEKKPCISLAIAPHRGRACTWRRASEPDKLNLRRTPFPLLYLEHETIPTDVRLDLFDVSADLAE
ncbi:hypothetical protein Sinac_1449 [Singulisphaera acidiphila DSM 18658]|uniref:Uncharacterized protein n=1 Tax=Singulisphaera acidiphila (strain ATCC BAA-1392 / DSM 18658 / VKM B-2454 / MOB10) TaxID=886293 RepID=L0DAY3_SINAD|nr:hypothetical protein Sinac_1449 [Singulisphaera acidiphila DSM 18658]